MHHFCHDVNTLYFSPFCEIELAWKRGTSATVQGATNLINAYFAKLLQNKLILCCQVLTSTIAMVMSQESRWWQ